MSFRRKFNYTTISNIFSNENGKVKTYHGLLKEETIKKRAKQQGMQGIISVEWNNKGERSSKEIKV